MIAFATCTFGLALLVLIVRWFAAIPLIQSITTSIDEWADSVHGKDAEPLA